MDWERGKKTETEGRKRGGREVSVRRRQCLCWIPPRRNRLPRALLFPRPLLLHASLRDTMLWGAVTHYALGRGLSGLWVRKSSLWHDALYPR